MILRIASGLAVVRADCECAAMLRRPRLAAPIAQVQAPTTNRRRDARFHGFLLLAMQARQATFQHQSYNPFPKAAAVAASASSEVRLRPPASTDGP